MVESGVSLRRNVKQSRMVGNGLPHPNGLAMTRDPLTFCFAKRGMTGGEGVLQNERGVFFVARRGILWYHLEYIRVFLYLSEVGR